MAFQHLPTSLTLLLQQFALFQCTGTPKQRLSASLTKPNCAYGEDTGPIQQTPQLKVKLDAKYRQCIPSLAFQLLPFSLLFLLEQVALLLGALGQLGGSSLLRCIKLLLLSLQCCAEALRLPSGFLLHRAI